MSYKDFINEMVDILLQGAHFFEDNSNNSSLMLLENLLGLPDDRIPLDFMHDDEKITGRQGKQIGIPITLSGHSLDRSIHRRVWRDDLRKAARVLSLLVDPEFKGVVWAPHSPRKISRAEVNLRPELGTTKGLLAETPKLQQRSFGMVITPHTKLGTPFVNTLVIDKRIPTGEHEGLPLDHYFLTMTSDLSDFDLFDARSNPQMHKQYGWHEGLIWRPGMPTH